MVQLKYADPLEKNDFHAMNHVNNLKIEPHAKFNTATEIILPKKLDIFDFLGDAYDQPNDRGFTIVGTEITQEIILSAATIAAVQIAVPAEGPESIILNHVYVLSGAAMQWPTTCMTRLAFWEGSWPDDGINLSVVPFVHSLEFEYVANHSLVSLQKFTFPQEVENIKFGQGTDQLIKHLDPSKFARRVQFIHLDLSEYSTNVHDFYDCIPNLCVFLIYVVPC
jgi:hypothetical protein